MKKAIKILSSFLSIVLIVTMFSISLSAYAEGNNIIGYYEFTVVDNPYSEVEWDNGTLHAFKASTHAHTVRSDADIELNDTIWYHYMTGYEVFCLTDHGTVNGVDIEHNGVVTGATGANASTCGWTEDQTRCTLYGYQSFVHGNVDEISSTDYYNIIYGQQVGTYGDRPQALVESGRGMFNVPLGNEANAMSSNKCHVNTYNVSFAHGATRTPSWPESTVQESYDKGAYSRINHIGEWTDGNGDPSVYDSAWISDFVSIFETYCPNRPSYTESDSKWNHTNITGQQVKRGVIGIELVNTSDNRTRNDRYYVYDESLKFLAPQGINVYGFCEDDSHEESDINKNAQFFLVNDGTAWSEEDKTFYSSEYPNENEPWYGYTGDITKSMTNGQFYASSVNSKNSYELGDGFSAVGDYPSINYFNFDEETDQISLNVNNTEKVRIVADGVILDTITFNQSESYEEAVFDLNAYEDKINSYVRIYMTGKGGITYLQPILLSKSESKISTVEFNTPSTDTKVSVYDATGALMSAANGNVYVLPAGDYTYIASRPGYITSDPIPFTVTQAEIDNAYRRIIDVVLEKNSDITFTTFYVPETIYLNPADLKTFQYFVDRDNSTDGALNSEISTTGNVYFYREGATNTTMDYKVIDGSTLGSLDYTVETLENDEISATITAGSLATALSSGGNALLEWTATYTVNGEEFTSTTYSYIYAPLSGTGSVAAAGGFAQTKKAAGWLHSTMDITGTVWLSGVHSVSGGSAAYKFAPYGGEAVTVASDIGNITVTGSGMSTASDNSSGGSVDVYPNGSSAALTIDTSRYTNFNQIPGLSVGLDMNAANSCDSTDDSTIQYVNFGSVQLYSLSGVAANTLAGQRLFVSDNTDSTKDIDLAIDPSVPSISVVGQVYGYKSSRHDRVAGTITLNLSYVDKTSLRQQYENAIKNSYQSDWFETEDAYTDYSDTLKKTAIALGNPAATATEITSAAQAMADAISNVDLKAGTATINHIDINGNIIATEASEYTISDAVVFSSTEIDGYDYYNSWECVINGSVVKTGTDSYGSIMTTTDSCTFNFYYIPNKYSVAFNALDESYLPSGGTGNTATLNKDYILPTNTPEIEGYTFTGWYLDLTDGVYSPGETILWSTAENGTFTAVFESNTYSATVDLDGGTDFDVATFNCKFGDFFDIPMDIPTKEGFAFAGWQATSQSGIDLGIHVPGGRFTWDVAENVIFKATWTVSIFTVTFDANGGELSSSSVEIAYGGKYGTLPAPTREGYIFSGWYLDEKLTTAVTEDTIMQTAEDHTLYAKWTIGEYKITYYLNGEEYATEYYDYGEKVTALSSIYQPGYTFSGWSEIPTTMPAKDVTVTATLNLTDYTVTYIIDGEEYQVDTLHYGDTITPPSIPEIYGYTFSGWSGLLSTMPAQNITVTGSYEINKHYIYYYVDGALYDKAEYSYGAAVVAIAEPTKNGYTFSGWQNVPVNMPDEDVTVYGTFTGVPYTITYYVDGEEYKQETYAYGDAITPLEPPVKAGYTFSGWTSIPTTMPKRNVTVNGIFTANTYTYKFVLDGVEQTSWQITAKCGSAITAPVPTCEENYKFDGWTPSVPDIMGAESLTFYGTTSKAYSVYTFDINGATGTAPEAQKYAVEDTVDLPDDSLFAKTGYAFNGWSEDKNADEGVTTITVGANDITLYAVWSMMSIYIESAEDSTTVIDEINDLIYGIEEGLTENEFETQYVEIVGSNGEIDYETGLGFGTDTKIYVKNSADNTVVATYTLVVYGDVDGDGSADGQDVILAQMLADGILTEETVSPAIYEAADCNHDGDITAEDITEIINSGVRTFEIIQTK
ncbi:MAG: InlB B-repeat-containing protein [Clostridia bacterium]|nr:InlB B-repeat-containing protein [Clostridia bacterium]